MYLIKVDSKLWHLLSKCIIRNTGSHNLQIWHGNYYQYKVNLNRTCIWSNWLSTLRLCQLKCAVVSLTNDTKFQFLTKTMMWSALLHIPTGWFYRSLLASLSDSSKVRMSPSRTGPLTFLIIWRFCSPMNSTFTWVHWPCEPVRPKTFSTRDNTTGLSIVIGLKKNTVYRKKKKNNYRSFRCRSVCTRIIKIMKQWNGTHRFSGCKGKESTEFGDRTQNVDKWERFIITKCEAML